MGLSIKTKREIIKDVIQIFVDMDYDNNRIFIFALNKVNEKYNKRIIPIEEVYEIYENDEDKLKELADKAVLTVTPQEPKIGHWKAFIHSAYHGTDEDGEPIWREVTVYHCSQCNRRTVIKEKYCPNCGSYNGGASNGNE